MSEDLDPRDVRRREVLRLAVGWGVGVAVWGSLRPADADIALDVQILQTASSLEVLAVETYGVVLGTGPEGMDAPAARALESMAPEGARDALRSFLRETARQHDEHRKALRAQTTALAPTAPVQEAANPKFLPVARSADLSTPEKLVAFLALLEKVLTDTYLVNLTMLQDGRVKAFVASVMAVASQRLAHLRMVGALLGNGSAHLVAQPFPASRIKDLPNIAGRVPFPDAFHQVGGPESVAEPSSGAVR